jgi:hypothetical protein
MICRRLSIFRRVLSILFHFIRQRALVESQENIGDFLARCGAPPDIFSLYQSIARSQKHDSVFLSYATNDEDFAQGLYTELRNQGIDVWFAPHDMQGGQTIVDQITQAISAKNRVVLILSESSMSSGWVRTEIRKAMKAEPGAAKLFPISLIAYDRIREWELFDPDTGEDLALQIRGLYIPDFCDWQSPERFASAIDGLARALKRQSESPQL